MFVAKWSPGIQQNKPELEMVPVWLELTGVPLQFFNRDALKEIAGLVGHPVRLHPSTENLTDIEVAKVYTIIDPRKPIPEYVNARFESGDISRISVSSPWLPSLCSYCKKVGHTISRCKSAPRTCTLCNSAKHTTANCPRKNNEAAKGKMILKRPHPPSRNLVYKPIVNQNNDTRPKAKDISVKKNLPLSNNQPQAVEKGECSKSSINNALRANPFSASGEDLEEGEICVDLTGFGGSHHSHTSSSSEDSLPDSLTGSGDEDEDKSNDGHDKYIEVISKRFKKQSKYKEKARARGPPTL